MRKLAIALAGLATALAVALGGASLTANAATPGCQAIPGHACQSYVTPAGGGLALDAFRQHTAADTPVIAFTPSQSDRAEDFWLVPVPLGSVSIYGYSGSQTGTTTEALVNIEYAPDGNPSGMCVSDIDPIAGQPAELRPCVSAAGKYNPFQSYVELQAGVGDGQFITFEDSPVSLEGTATGLYLSASLPQNRAPVTSQPGATGAFTEGQLWEAGNG